MHTAIPPSGSSPKKSFKAARLRTGRQLVRLAHDGALEQALAKRAETDQRRQDYALLASFIQKLAKAPPNVKKGMPPNPGRSPRPATNSRQGSRRGATTSTSESSQDPPGDLSESPVCACRCGEAVPPGRQYVNVAHRQRAYRARRAKPKAAVCARCGETFVTNKQGRPRKYCQTAVCNAARSTGRSVKAHAVSSNTIGRCGASGVGPFPVSPYRRSKSGHRTAGMRIPGLSRPWRIDKWSDPPPARNRESRAAALAGNRIAPNDRKVITADQSKAERTIIAERDDSAGELWLRAHAKAEKAKAEEETAKAEELTAKAEEMAAEAEEKATANYNRARRDCGLSDAPREQRAPKDSAEATPRNIPATPRRRRNKATA